LRERYERLRDQAIAGRAVTLAMRIMVDHGAHAWIEAFGSRSCSPTSRAAMQDPPVRTSPTQRPTELIGLLATLISNRRTTEVHAGASGPRFSRRRARVRDALRA
jgi:hypothetical protein